jgi:hypothetical protein
MTNTTAEQPRERLVQICAALPEVDISGDQHLAFRVRKKTFAYYLNDHHGDGRIALCCKAYPGDQEHLIAWDPARFYVPAYLGPKGWVALRLDLDSIDWGQVSERIMVAYRLVAPKQLAARIAPPSQ